MSVTLRVAVDVVVYCCLPEQTSFANTKSNSNDISLLRLTNKFVRQVHGGRVTSCKVFTAWRTSLLRCVSSIPVGLW